MYQYFLDNQNRRMLKPLHYFPIYERYFSKYRNKSLVFLEIGVLNGGSLQMWKRFFGPHATIIGIDINEECKRCEEHNVHVRIGNQADHAFLSEVIHEFGKPDIVLDDGSHRMSDIKATFDYLYDQVDPNGIYMVEDLCTAYDARYEGGLRREGTFIEYSKQLIDELHAFNVGTGMEPTPFTKQTYAMHVYDMVVVFEKMRHVPFVQISTGKL